VALFKLRLLVAFDASAVAGVAVPRRLGTRRVRALARVALPDGALLPAPLDENLADPASVQAALRELRARLGGEHAALILPDGLARTLLLEIPRGADPRGFARFRLEPSLPYPATEAVVDVLRVGRGRFLAAAVRARVVRSYEAAARAAGFVQERVDLAPLAALAALLRSRGRRAGVDLILGDVALSLAAFDAQGELRAFRSRRRDPGLDEPARLREEVERTAALAGIGQGLVLRVVGEGAPALSASLSSGGRSVEAGWRAAVPGQAQDAAEPSWLGAALA
jgi:hypothetical protein